MAGSFRGREPPLSAAGDPGAGRARRVGAVGVVKVARFQHGIPHPRIQGAAAMSSQPNSTASVTRPMLADGQRRT
jgi:hypothetical protein